MADLSNLVDELSRLTVLEAAELATLLEDKWRPSKVRQSMVSVEDIQKDLSGWPDEVVREGCTTLPTSPTWVGLRRSRLESTDGVASLVADRCPGGKESRGKRSL